MDYLQQRLRVLEQAYLSSKALARETVCLEWGVYFDGHGLLQQPSFHGPTLESALLRLQEYLKRRVRRPMPDQLEERIRRLEAPFIKQGYMAGTILQRVMCEDSGVEWCLAVGGLGLPKAFFYGDTIEGALQKAEEHFGLK